MRFSSFVFQIYLSLLDSVSSVSFHPFHKNILAATFGERKMKRFMNDDDDSSSESESEQTHQFFDGNSVTLQDTQVYKKSKEIPSEHDDDDFKVSLFSI